MVPVHSLNITHSQIETNISIDVNDRDLKDDVCSSSSQDTLSRHTDAVVISNNHCKDKEDENN